MPTIPAKSVEQAASLVKATEVLSFCNSLGTPVRFGGSEKYMKCEEGRAVHRQPAPPSGTPPRTPSPDHGPGSQLPERSRRSNYAIRLKEKPAQDRGALFRTDYYGKDYLRPGKKTGLLRQRPASMIVRRRKHEEPRSRRRTTTSSSVSPPNATWFHRHRDAKVAAPRRIKRSRDRMEASAQSLTPVGPPRFGSCAQAAGFENARASSPQAVEEGRKRSAT